MTIPLISRNYIDLVKRVALGMSIEDGEEMARGLYAIRPHERFTTHILGSAWLCYAVMLAWFWTPTAIDITLEQQPDAQRVYDYELALQAGVRALNVWNFSQRNVGIAHALVARPAAPEADEEVASGWAWPPAWQFALSAALLILSLYQPHTAGISAAAFTPFYLVGGGTGSADVNAGSSIGAAQSAPATGGSWVNATRTYVAPSGTPFATTVAGDYVSVYVDGGTVTAYVAKVTTVVSNVSVILDASVKYGTAPTDGGANRSAVAGGSWNTEQPLCAGGFAGASLPQSTKINVTGNLSLGASRTISLVGSSTVPLWISGYNANPGDLDADTTNSLAKPVWTLGATFVFSTGGAQQTISSLSLVGNRTNTIWTASGTFQKWVRCRSENTSSNTAAVGCTATTVMMGYCYFKAPSTAATGSAITTSGTSSLFGCVVDNGGTVGLNSTSNQSLVYGCVFLNGTNGGAIATTGNMQFISTTLYGGYTSIGIVWSGTPNIGSCVVSCLLSGLNGSTAMAIGISGGGNNIFRANNDYYNVTTPESGLGDSFEFFPHTDSNPVVTSATDMTPVAGSNARNNRFPGVMENNTFSPYSDIGAVDHQDGPVGHITGARSIGTY